MSEIDNGYLVVTPGKSPEGPFSLHTIGEMLKEGIFPTTISLTDPRTSKCFLATDHPYLRSCLPALIHSSESSVKPSSPALPAVCPVCKSLDAVRAVPALFREGSWSAKTVGNHITTIYDRHGHAASAYGTSVHTTGGASNLAQTLAPPPPPQRRHSAWFGGALVFFLGGLVGPFQQIAALTIAGGVGTLLAIGVGVSQNPSFQSIYDKRLHDWEATMAIWNRLIYCSRCDLVVDPETGNRRRANDMNSLLL